MSSKNTRTRTRKRQRLTEINDICFGLFLIAFGVLSVWLDPMWR